jgi:hypothetical protein
LAKLFEEFEELRSEMQRIAMERLIFHKKEMENVKKEVMDFKIK